MLILKGFLKGVTSMKSRKRFRFIGVVLGLLALAASYLPLLTPITLATTHDATVNGFLYPWTGTKTRMRGGSGAHPPGGNALDFSGGAFAVLAPKDGEVVYRADDSWRTGTCDGAIYAANYVVLGHGPITGGNAENPEFDHYSLYYHLAYGSIPDDLEVGDRVHVGEFIGTAGNTGYSLPSEGGTGIHLHMEVS